MTFRSTWLWFTQRKARGGTATLVVATSLAVAMPVLGAEHQPWGTSGPWEVIIDPDAGPGCYMETIMADGTKVRFGALPERGGGFIAALNRDWQKGKADQTGTARFDFGKDLFKGETVAISEGDWHGGTAFFNNPVFLDNFERGNAVTIQGDAGLRFDVSLSGTKRAIADVLKCQEEQDRIE